jgi:pimeloyl-ACP methyl ester carboxylesterase
VSVDLLGYGASDRPDGLTLTNQAYSAIVAQIVKQLRSATYQARSPRSFHRVGVVGHSGGGVVAEHVAGGLADVDALVVIAWTHFPSQQAIHRFTSEEIPLAAGSGEDYYEFGGERRASWFFNPGFADPQVVERDGELAGLTPTGHPLSALVVTSRAATAAVGAPVLLVLGTGDFIFPVEFADEELALFVRSTDRSVYLAPDAAHAVLLHPNAPQTAEAIITWLGEHSNAIRPCAGK